MPTASKKALASLVLMFTAALSLTACSSSSKSNGAGSGGSSAQGTAAKPAGSVIKIGVIGSFKTAGFDASSEIASAKAAARALNAAGGIAGHQVQIEECNDQFTITGATACGRKMISDKVLAVTGNSIFDAGFQPLLATAGIPIVGQTASSIQAYTGSNEYLMTSGTLFELYGAAYSAASHGSKSIYVSRADVAVTAAITATIKAASAKVGYKAAGDQAVPNTVTDMSPYVQQFKSSGADSVLLGYASGQAIKFATTASSLGVTGKTIIYTAGNLQNSDIAKLGPEASNFVLAAGMPPLTATQIPGVKLFISQLAAEKAAGDSDAGIDVQSESSFQTWLALQAISKIAPTTGDLTPATLTAALNSAKDVDLMGVIPAWTPNKPGGAPYTRISNPSVYIEKIVGGQLVLAQPDEIDVRANMGI